MSTTQFEVRTGRPSGYTSVGDWVLLAPITDRAVRIYCLLRMHCEGLTDDEAWPSQRTLASMLGVKKADTIQNAIKELVELGAVEVQTVAAQHGRHNRYVVHLSPPPGYEKGPRDRTSYYAARQGGTPKSGVTRSVGYPEIRGDGYPEIRGDGSPQISGQKQYKVEAVQTEISQEQTPSSNADASAATEPEPDGALFDASERVVPISQKADAGFERWWTIYPRREGKQAARKSFDKALRAVDLDRLCAGAERYARHVKYSDRRYIKQPTTWLNQGCWDDELGAPPRAAASSGGPNRIRDFVSPVDQSVYDGQL